jgi:hypothetical protein
MRRLGARPIMLSMTRPIAATKVLLVADRRSDEAGAGGAESMTVRRYRLARLRFDSRPAGPDARFEHLKRVYE